METSNSQDKDTLGAESSEPNPSQDVAETINPEDAGTTISTNHNDKEEKDKSSGGVLAMWKDFGDNTSMHGLGRAINSPRIWKKVVWSILVIGAACVASRNLYMTFVDYFSYPVSTTVSLNVKQMVKFPAVTLCNLNPYRMSPMKKEIQDRLERSVKEGDSVRRQKEIFTMYFNKHYDVFNLPREIRHSFGDMLIDCLFDSNPCDADAFLVVSNKRHGDCYTFNSDSVEMSFRAGNRNGLILEVDVEQNEYLPFTPAAGLKVLIHPPDVVPFPHEAGIVVRPGVSTSIGIRQIVVKRQIPPWGSCIKEKDTKRDHLNMFRGEAFNAHAYGYSQMACEKTCYQLELMDRCNCCDLSYPCYKDIRDCNQTIKEILDCQSEVRKDYFSGMLGCNAVCWPPCQETMYRSSYSAAAWPSEKYVVNFDKKAGDVRQRMNRTGQVTSEDLRKNFVRLEVYFETLTEEEIAANPAYNWNKLLSDLGGQLGLWMGFSLMTAIEFLELGWDFIGKLCCNMCGACRRSSATSKC